MSEVRVPPSSAARRRRFLACGHCLTPNSGVTWIDGGDAAGNGAIRDVQRQLGEER